MRKAPFYIFGNWKSNKTVEEVVIWCRDFETLIKREPIATQKVKLVICAPFIHLTTLKSLIYLKHLPFELGVQNISSFAVGAYTGETSASMVKDLATYTLVGHSERRNYFKETDEDLAQKVKLAKSAGIEPVYCVQSESMNVPVGVQFVGYEPVWAIGTGKAETAENADNVASHIKKKNESVKVVYGGSVTPDNVASYVTMEHIDGVLPGGASLKPELFHRLGVNASRT